MERSQNWPDLRSPISKFWDIRFIDNLACSNLWKFQGNRSVGVALRNIQTFYEVRSLDVTWWPDLAWSGSEIFTTCAEMIYDKVCQKQRRYVPPFLSYSQKKTSWGVFKHPPAGRGLSYRRSGTCHMTTCLARVPPRKSLFCPYGVWCPYGVETAPARNTKLGLSVRRQDMLTLHVATWHTRLSGFLCDGAFSTWNIHMSITLSNLVELSCNLVEGFILKGIIRVFPKFPS